VPPLILLGRQCPPIVADCCRLLLSLWYGYRSRTHLTTPVSQWCEVVPLPQYFHQVYLRDKNYCHFYGSVIINIEVFFRKSPAAMDAICRCTYKNLRCYHLFCLLVLARSVQRHQSVVLWNPVIRCDENIYSVIRRSPCSSQWLLNSSNSPTHPPKVSNPPYWFCRNIRSLETYTVSKKRQRCSRDVAERVRYQMVICYPTLANWFMFMFPPVSPR